MSDDKDRGRELAAEHLVARLFEAFEKGTPRAFCVATVVEELAREHELGKKDSATDLLASNEGKLRATVANLIAEADSLIKKSETLGRELPHNIEDRCAVLQSASAIVACLLAAQARGAL